MSDSHSDLRINDSPIPLLVQYLLHMEVIHDERILLKMAGCSCIHFLRQAVFPRNVSADLTR
jgi:hypothetical protein